MPTLSPRMRQILRILGFIALGLFTFIYALHLTFPYDRVKDRMVEALSSKYEVTVVDVERSVVPGRFALKGVTLTSRPSVAGQPVTTMFFKKVEVDVAFLPLVSGKAKIDLDIATGGGSMTGRIEASKANLAVDFRLKRVPLATIPGISDAVGLPLGGLGDGRITLKLPRNDWQKASGKVDLACTIGCTVGDDVARVYPKAKREADALMVKDGFPVKTITVARFVLGIVIAKGEAIRDKFEFESPDGDIEIDFQIKLAKKIADSTITGCIRYKCAPEYLSKSPAACELGSPAVDQDGFRNIKLAGRLGTMRRLGAVCDAGGSPDDVFSKEGREGFDQVRSRPTLDSVPEAPPPVDPAASPTPPPIQTGRPPAVEDINRPDPGTSGGAMGSGTQPEPMPGDGAPTGEHLKGEPKGEAPTGEQVPAPPHIDGTAPPPEHEGGDDDR